MSWTSWQTTPATEDTSIEHVWTFLKKISVPRGLFTLIRVQFFYPAMEKLAYYLTAQSSLKLLRDFRVGAAAPKDHMYHGIIQPTCCSCIRAGERELRIVHASTTRGFTLTLSELQRDGDQHCIITTSDYIQIIPVHVSLVTDRRVTTSRTSRTGF